MKAILTSSFLAILCGQSLCQNQIATPWAEMIPEDMHIQAVNESSARKVLRANLPAYTPDMGYLVSARVQIFGDYGTSQQLGQTTPFRYSVEQLGNTPISGYNGTYGSVTLINVANCFVGGMGAWFGMCGGQSLTAYDGSTDGAGSSGHTTGNQIGQWAQETQWHSATGIPEMIYGGIDGSGLVPVSAIITAQGFISDWNSPGHYFRRWETLANLNGERALSLKVRIVYETL